MKVFHFEDKRKNMGFRGIVPNDDVDCPPFLYCRLTFAYHMDLVFSDMIKARGLPQCPADKRFAFVLKIVDEEILKLLSAGSPQPQIFELLSNESLKFKKQKRLLKGLKLEKKDILWLYKEAEDLGYLLDTTLVEKHPAKYDEKKMPHIFYQNKDGSMDVIGDTDMTETEMKAYLEERKVIQVRLFHNKEHWHCFYYTFKGLAGKEHGEMGRKPHYHYLSDKSGITWNQLQDRIKACEMPSSDVHILVNNPELL